MDCEELWEPLDIAELPPLLASGARPGFADDDAGAPDSPELPIRFAGAPALLSDVPFDEAPLAPFDVIGDAAPRCTRVARLRPLAVLL